MDTVKEIITVVVPVFNEESNLPELHRRLVQVLRDQMELAYEIIFVDDGSSDSSWATIRSLHETDPCVRGLQLSRNFGQHVAMVAGLEACRGNYLVFMDSDLEEPPEAIPLLFERLNKDRLDIVIGLRPAHSEGQWRSFLSNAYARVFAFCVHEAIQPNATNLRIITSKVISALKRCGERRKFLGGLMGWTGFATGYVRVKTSARCSGRTSYTVPRLITHALNGIISFSIFPLRLAMFVGLLFAAVSFTTGVVTVIRKLVTPEIQLGYASLLTAILFTGSVVLTCLGVVGEYVGRIYEEVQNRPGYLINEEI